MSPSSSPWRLSGRHSRRPFQKAINGFELLIAKSIAELWGPRISTACSGRTGKYKHRAFLSRLQSLLALFRKKRGHFCYTNSEFENQKMDNCFCPLRPHFSKSCVHFSKILPSWGPYCPVGVQVAQTEVHFVQFQVQARMAACHAVIVPLHAVKLLYTTTFHEGLKVATICCVVVLLCFVRDQPDTTGSCRKLHGGRLGPIGGYWGPTGRCVHFESPQTRHLDAPQNFLIANRG